MERYMSRQPRPVHVTVAGDVDDINSWAVKLMRAAGYKGDMVQENHASPAGTRSFVIYPRAVND
jgi:hypothetical protein